MTGLRRCGGLLVLVAWLACAAPAAHALLPQGNLLVNGDAEQGPSVPNADVPSSTGVARPLIGWETFQNATAVKYNQGGFPADDEGDPVGHGGTAFFAGGPGLGQRFMTQERFLDAATVDAIAQGGVVATVQGDFGGWMADPDRAELRVDFGTSPESTPTSVSVGPVGYFERMSTTKLLHKLATIAVPAGTTYMRATITFTDANGQYVDGYADNLSVTLTGPLDTEITDGPAGPTNDATPTFAFAASPSDGATFLCGVDVATPATPCTTPYATGPLADGEHTFAVAATRNGETDTTPATRTFTVDTVPPDLQIKLGPPDPVQPGVYPGPTKVEVVVTDANGIAFTRCKIDPSPGQVLPTCGLTGGGVTVSAPGPHRVVAEAADSAGNPAGADVSFVISTPPTAQITSPPLGTTSDSTPAFTFTSDQTPSTFECRVDTANFAACDTGDAVAALADGGHTFAVRATNDDGVTGPAATETFTVDTAGPSTTIALGPPDPVAPGVYVGATRAEVAATDAGSGVGETRCVLDPDTVPAGFADLPAACPYLGGANVAAAGAHTIYAASRDLAGNVESPVVSRAFTIRATPTTTITGGPSGFTQDATPAFTFASDAQNATFDCAIDLGALGACATGDPLAALADGSHTFQVNASADGVRDPAGAARTFFVDTAAPVADIVLDPASGVAQDAMRFQVNADDPSPASGVDQYRCVLDPDSAPATFADLPDTDCPWRPFQDGPAVRGPGMHTVYAAARDAAGNVSTVVSRSFRVLQQSQTVITAGPDGPTNDSTPAFAFAAAPDDPAATFACRFDDAPASACTSPLQPATPLADGSHVFRVVATVDGIEAAGAQRTFTVDTTAPETTIALPFSATFLQGRPLVYTGAVLVQVSATDAGAGVEQTRCAVDRPAASYADLPPEPCAFLGAGGTVVAPGEHVVYAASRDRVSNTESPVVQRAFKIREEVDTRILSKPADPTYHRTAAFTFDATIPGSTFECRLDAGAWVQACASPYTTTPNDGSHTFAVRAISPDGAIDTTPATWTWTIPRPLTTTSSCRVAIPWHQGEGHGQVRCQLQLLTCPPEAVCKYDARETLRESDAGTVWYRSWMEHWPSSWRPYSGPPYCYNHEGGYFSGTPLVITHRCDGRWTFETLGGAGRRPDPFCTRDEGGYVPCNPDSLKPDCVGETMINFGDQNTVGETPGRRGPDGQRFVSCEITLTVSTAPGLLAVAAGPAVQINAPGPGVLVLGALGRGRSAQIAARRLALTSRTKVQHAGAVTIKPRLSKAGRRRLRTRHRLPLTLRIRFIPVAGAPIAAKRRVVLTRPARPRPATPCTEFSKKPKRCR